MSKPIPKATSLAGRDRRHHYGERYEVYQAFGGEAASRRQPAPEESALSKVAPNEGRRPYNPQQVINRVEAFLRQAGISEVNGPWVRDAGGNWKELGGGEAAAELASPARQADPWLGTLLFDAGPPYPDTTIECATRELVHLRAAKQYLDEILAVSADAGHLARLAVSAALAALAAQYDSDMLIVEPLLKEALAQTGQQRRDGAKNNQPKVDRVEQRRRKILPIAKKVRAANKNAGHGTIISKLRKAHIEGSDATLMADLRALEKAGDLTMSAAAAKLKVRDQPT